MRPNPCVIRLLAFSFLAILTAQTRADDPPAPQSPAKVEDHEAPGDADPFAEGVATQKLTIPENKGAEVRTTLSLRLEIWEIDARKAVTLLDSASAKEIAEKIRPQLLADDSAKLAHTQLLALDERTQSASEAIVEQIYPTEYEPPEFPPNIPPAKPEPENGSEFARKLHDMLSAACPSSFDTRNTGLTFEAQVQPVRAEAGCWDTSLTIEEVLLVRKEQVGTPLLDTTMPVFSSFRIRTSIRLTESRWQLLGLSEPPRGKPDEPATRRWLSLVRIDRAR